MLTKAPDSLDHELTTSLLTHLFAPLPSAFAFLSHVPLIHISIAPIIGHILLFSPDKTRSVVDVTDTVLYANPVFLFGMNAQMFQMILFHSYCSVTYA